MLVFRYSDEERLAAKRKILLCEISKLLRIIRSPLSTAEDTDKALNHLKLISSTLEVEERSLVCSE